MHARLHAARLEEGGQLVAARRAHDVEVIDVVAVGPLVRQAERQAREGLVVARGQLAPVVVHGVEPAQQHATDGGLDVVEAQVEADLGVQVLVEPAVVAQAPAALGHRVLVGDDGAAVTHDREVLRGVEREDAHATERADLLALPRRAVRLRAVLQHPDAQPLGQRLHGVEVGGLPVEVHGHDADRARRRLGGGIGGIERVVAVAVDEHRRGLGKADRLDRRERGVRRHQDLVAGLHAQRAKRQPQPGRGRVAEDAVLGPRVAGQLGLELTALGAEDVLARLDGRDGGLLDLVVHRRTGQGNLRHVHAPDWGSFTNRS